MTERKSSQYTRCYSTDTKVNYGARNRSALQNADPQLMNFLARTKQPQAYTFNKSTQQKEKRSMKQVESGFTTCIEKYKNIAIDPKSLLVLIAVIVLSIGIYAFDFTIELGPDEDCWQKFKDNNCSFTNPSGLICRRLLKCISGQSWQLDIFYLLLSALGGWGGFRFRKQIKTAVIKGIELWQNFLQNK